MKALNEIFWDETELAGDYAPVVTAWCTDTPPGKEIPVGILCGPDGNPMYNLSSGGTWC